MINYNAIKVILSKLIAYRSVSPDDAGCQLYIREYLLALGFKFEEFNHGAVTNSFFYYGSKKPAFIFAGHTDVVAAGDEILWLFKPFELVESAEQLYGRGVADMKGSIACMLVAITKFIKNYPIVPNGIGILLTSGEEGDDYASGTPYIMQILDQQKRLPAYCVLGEPSSHNQVGDCIRIGRRGSLTAKIIVQGVQGHVAYPDLAVNAIHLLSPVLIDLTAIQWDQGNAYFPPTTMQIIALNTSNLGGNIIPGEVHLELNIRFSTEHTVASLQQIIADCFQRHKLAPIINWYVHGQPFLTPQGVLLEAMCSVINANIGQVPLLSTAGGTSDGRFIAPYGVEVIELGLVNTTIHQINENIHAQDLIILSNIYHDLLVYFHSNSNYN